ncbi:MAG: glycoside hydrolase family 2 protein [Verrucomicrobiota bacterium]
MVVDLTGPWQLSGPDGLTGIAATVPGCVHADLERAGLIPQPYYRDNESQLAWVSHAGWRYAREFEVPPALLALDRVVLECDGLDTLAEIELNGEVLGKTDNMFRAYRFDVKDRLRLGINRIEIRFRSPLVEGIALRTENPLMCGGHPSYRYDVRNYFRKQQSNFGWDWAPKLVTCGIWRPIRLAGFDLCRIRSLTINQRLEADGRAFLRIACQTEIARDPEAGLRLLAELQDASGTIVVTQETTVRTDVLELELKVENPALWWPNGLGDPALYDLSVRLMDRESTELDRRTRSIGFRRLELVREKDACGESFFFRVNGVPFFAKGANWVTPDHFPAAAPPERYRQLIAGAVAAHFNMLRVWGGGIYETDEFYDLCDRHGLCVWQDFAFACASYPINRPDFLTNCLIEAEEQVGRLHHHACLALWCGNNELEGKRTSHIARWEDGSMPLAEYSRFFDHQLADIVHRFTPDAPYWPSSPHSPCGDRFDRDNPNWGDAHLWQIGNMGEPIGTALGYKHRFVSEFGMESFACPESVAEFTAPTDRVIGHPVMTQHQKNPRAYGRSLMYVLDLFRMPVDFEATLWLSQIAHGHGLAFVIEQLRRQQPRSMGALYWMLNDAWPANGFSSIDYYGRWKATHWLVRRAYEPLLLSIVHLPLEDRIEIHALNDLRRPLTGRFSLDIVGLDGGIRFSHSETLALPAAPSTSLVLPDMPGFSRAGDFSDALLRATFVSESAATETIAWIVPPRLMELPDPELTFTVGEPQEAGAEIVVSCRRPALYVRINGISDGSATDNFFHVLPDRPRRIVIAGTTTKKKCSGDSLFDRIACAK